MRSGYRSRSNLKVKVLDFVLFGEGVIALMVDAVPQTANGTLGDNSAGEGPGFSATLHRSSPPNQAMTLDGD